MKKILSAIVIIFLLSACGSQPESVPTATLIPPTALPSETSAPTDTPAPTQDPTLFGAIGVNEIQAFALEPVASEIFTRVMNGFVADDEIFEYQILRVTIFPGENGLLSEITFNVKTTDSSWLTDGGIQASDNWINDKCYRFDFVSTETEHQLKNKRLCN